MALHRTATNDELIGSIAYYLKANRPIRFRHFLLELYAPHARNGVQHRQFSRQRITMVDGTPHVKHHGKLEQLTASLATLECGKTIVYDIRLKGLS